MFKKSLQGPTHLSNTSSSAELEWGRQAMSSRRSLQPDLNSKKTSIRSHLLLADPGLCRCIIHLPVEYSVLCVSLMFDSCVWLKIAGRSLCVLTQPLMRRCSRLLV